MGRFGLALAIMPSHSGLIVGCALAAPRWWHAINSASPRFRWPEWGGEKLDARSILQSLGMPTSDDEALIIVTSDGYGLTVLDFERWTSLKLLAARS